MYQTDTNISFSFKLIVYLLGFLLVLSSTLNAQSFLNGDLNGTVGEANAPTGWSLIPFTDFVCAATDAAVATTDLSDNTAPNSGSGVPSTPYSGATFVSGLHKWTTNMFFPNRTYQEGIMQTVSGFTIGNSYDISLYQAVIKQTTALDQSGSWSIYIDNVFVATTAPTTSTLPYNDLNHPWENRVVSFTATSTSHTIKFLPKDDDGNISTNATALRMGLDNVSIIAPLPIELLNYKAHCKDGYTNLTWTTSSEINNDFFTIERSTDAINFEPIALVQGNGNSSTTIEYSWADDSQLSTTTYYRLKQTDFNGAFEYFEIKTVSCENSGDISIYPNPFENSFTVQLPENTTYPINIEVHDYLGRKVHGQQLNNETQLIKVDLEQDLSTGAYFVKVFNDTTQVIEKIMKII